MEKQKHKRSSFSGKLGFVLAAAGASVGLGNIWRFPYLAAKYGGGIFLLIYIILALTFGYTMITAETAIGRMTQKSPVGAYRSFGKSKWLDKRSNTDSDSAILLCYRRLGHQISL
jgi:NSS family neurotransmitter:Na+ symporter